MSFLPAFMSVLGVDAPTGGHLVSAYALDVGVGAPLLAVTGARLEPPLPHPAADVVRSQKLSQRDGIELRRVGGVLEHSHKQVAIIPQNEMIACRTAGNGSPRS